QVLEDQRRDRLRRIRAAVEGPLRLGTDVALDPLDHSVRVQRRRGLRRLAHDYVGTVFEEHHRRHSLTDRRYSSYYFRNAVVVKIGNCGVGGTQIDTTIESTEFAHVSPRAFDDAAT